MILDMKPVHLADVKDLAGDLENNQPLADYLKKFNEKTKEQADALAEELRGLGNAKLKEASIIKLVDHTPKDKTDLAKLFTDIALDEQETNEILAITTK